MPPIIAISGSLLPETSRAPERVSINTAYLRAVQGAGLTPLVLMPQLEYAGIEAAMAAVSGLVLTGGGDVDPARYGEAPGGTRMDSVSCERDTAEFMALELAFARKLPVFAICRGMQVLNVALGGSLWQDLPSQNPSDIEHSQTSAGQPRGVATHEVRIAAGTRLHQVLGRARLPVNSMHHQAVRNLGEGLVATAWADDGVIEALELPGEPFILGVQWHPEELAANDEYARKLFAAFAAAVGGK